LQSGQADTSSSGGDENVQQNVQSEPKLNRGANVPPDGRKPRAKQEAKCVECGKVRLINKGSVPPERCKACALNRGWGRKA